MHLASIASGSSGNCIYIGSEKTHLIIDAGISGKKIEQGLNLIGLKTSELDGILITHEHSDHIKGIGVVARKCGIPIFATNDTACAILSCKSLGEIPEGLIRIINKDEDFSINDLTIHPFSSSHDAIDPTCYTIKRANKKIGFATDLGNYNDYIINNLSDSDLLFIEANHDVNMLSVGRYPYYLKRRILSDKGHLSNERSGQLISEVIHDNLKRIILGHLSKENNFEELAYETVQAEVNRLTSYNCSDFNMLVAKRDDCTELIAI